VLLYLLARAPWWSDRDPEDAEQAAAA
jgi:hypothetical protein